MTTDHTVAPVSDLVPSYNPGDIMEFTYNDIMPNEYFMLLQHIGIDRFTGHQEWYVLNLLTGINEIQIINPRDPRDRVLA